MAAFGLTIGPDGYFSRNGQRFVPVGVNYWPACCRTEMWQLWPADEIQRDLDLVRYLGLNSIRFFLRWEDFEPTPGQYDSLIFERLTEFLTWCAQRDLAAQPTLFAPHVPGRAFGPAWRLGRNFFDDDFMRQRAVDFAFTVGRVAAPHHEHLIGIDLGHELSRLPDCQTASVAAIQAWCRDVASAVSGGYRNALLVCGNGVDQLTRDTGWRVGEVPGCDFLAMHGNTLPHEHPLVTDGLIDPLTQSILPLNTEIARSFGAVMVQDVGLLPMTGPRQMDEYLRGVLPACWNAGANGFLWTSLRDFRTPGSTRIVEDCQGLVDDLDAVKPGLGYFLDFAHTLSVALRPKISPQYVGLYVHRAYYPRENPANAANEPRDVWRSLAIANYLLRQAGYEVRIIRGDRPISPRTKTLWITGANLSADEADALAPWVAGGGRLIWHGPDPLNWGDSYDTLLGAKVLDHRAPDESLVQWAGAEWKLDAYPRNVRAEIQPTTAALLAVDHLGMPMVLRQPLGRGTVTYALPSVDEVIARNAQRASRDRWLRWYQGMLRN